MKIEKLIKEGIVKLEMYNSVSEHTAEYGLDAKNPLFIKHLSIAESHRLKGIGNKVLKYLDDYAEKIKTILFLGIFQMIQYSHKIQGKHIFRM